jgi:hypothetical protein
MSRLDRFGEKLIDVWRAVVRDGTFTLNCGSGEEGRKKSSRLRFRLYDLRKAMHLDKHDLYEATKHQTIRIIRDAASNYLVLLESKDQDLQLLLDSVESEEAPTPELPELPE